MNVACTACPAKYAVPDDKVRGKRARITCKHCGTAIIIDGTGLAAPVGSVPAPSAPTASVPAASAPLAASQPPVTEAAAPTHNQAISERPGISSAAVDGLGAPSSGAVTVWVVALSEDRQESASTARVLELFATRVIDAETYIWREGMSEWKPPFEIAELAAALREKGFSPRAVEDNGNEEEATVIVPPSSERVRHRRAPRTLPSSTEDDEGVTIARESAPPSRPAAREESRADVAEPPATSSRPTRAIRAASSRPAADETRRPTRARAITRVGLGSAVAERGSQPPANRQTSGPSSRPPDSRSQRPASAVAAEEARENARAARKSGRRTERATLDDLFGQQELAGQEDDPALGMRATASEDPGQRLTGARNESSVLFSLDALVQAERASEAPRRPTASSADLMLSSGPSPLAFAATGGGFMNSLAAPDFTAPARPEPPPALVQTVSAAEPSHHSTAPQNLPMEAPRRRGRFVVYGLLLLGGALATGLAMGVPQKLLTPEVSPQGATPQSVAAVETTAERARAVDAPAETAAEASTSAVPAASAAAPERVEPTRGAASPARQVRKEPSKDAEPSPTPARPPTFADVIAKEKSAGKEQTPADDAKAAEPPTEAAAAPPFDRAAAVQALGGAAGSAQSCKMLGGPTGSGQATVTFAPSGRVTSASVSGDFAGSSVGSCVAKLFRSARVPAFSGDAVTVSKRFSID